MIPQTLQDIINSITKAIMPENLYYLNFHKERYRPICLVTLNGRIPNNIWWRIQRQVKVLGGRWRRHQTLWEVPLNVE